MRDHKGMRDHDDEVDFFMEDEPVEQVIEAFERGEKGVTLPPWAGVRFSADPSPSSVPSIGAPGLNQRIGVAKVTASSQPVRS